MTKLRSIVGVAFVAMSLLTGFAISTAHADDSLDQDGLIIRADEARLMFDQEDIRELQ
jgi:hypothetical protein